MSDLKFQPTAYDEWLSRRRLPPQDMEGDYSCIIGANRRLTECRVIEGATAVPKLAAFLEESRIGVTHLGDCPIIGRTVQGHIRMRFTR